MGLCLGLGWPDEALYDGVVVGLETSGLGVSVSGLRAISHVRATSHVHVLTITVNNCLSQRNVTAAIAMRQFGRHDRNDRDRQEQTNDYKHEAYDGALEHAALGCCIRSHGERAELDVVEDGTRGIFGQSWGWGGV